MRGLKVIRCTHAITDVPERMHAVVVDSHRWRECRCVFLVAFGAGCCILHGIITSESYYTCVGQGLG